MKRTPDKNPPTSAITEVINDYLIVDDNEVFATTLARALTRLNNNVQTCQTAQQAIERNRRLLPTRIILDLKLEQSSGLQLIVPLRHDNPTTEIVVLTGYSSISTAVEAIKLGAHHYLCKPAGIHEVISAFDKDAGSSTTQLPDNPPSVNRLEWEHIQGVLHQNDGNVSATARALGMHRRTLQRKLQKRPARD